MSGESTKNESTNQNSGAWGDFDNFAGEKNINDKTGKERTFSEFDNYPRLPGESSQEYGARLKDMHEKTAAYLAEQQAQEEASKAITNAQGLRTENYLNSDSGKKELDAEASYDRVAKSLERYVQDGIIPKDHADRLLERKLNNSINAIENARQDYENGKTGDEAEYEKWLEERGFKEEPATKEPITEKVVSEEDTSLEKTPNIRNVLDETKDRLIEELGPIIYNQVMASITENINRIFAGIKLESDTQPAPQPAESKPAESKLVEDKPVEEISEKDREREAIQAEIDKIQKQLGKEPIENNKATHQSELDNTQKEITETLNKMREHGATRILNIIEDNSNQIGGQKGVDILTGKGIIDANTCEMWWSSLDEKGQAIVRSILAKNKELGYKNGDKINQSFVEWLGRQDDKNAYLNSHGLKVA